MRVVTQHDLERFRQDNLSPEALLRVMDTHVRAIAQLAVGVGKSHACDSLLESEELHRQFDFVIYSAPTWNILRERRIVRGVTKCPVPWMMLMPRPKDRCADFAEAWSGFESRGCSTYAKATLCKTCQQLNLGIAACDWPSQFSRIKEHRQLFCTEQNLLLNRALVPTIRGLAGAKRIAVILDEARLLDADFTVRMSREDITAFATALTLTPVTAQRDRWLAELARILEWRDPGGLDLDLPPSLHRDAFQIQKAGIERHGDEFRYSGYDLSLFATSRPEERWISSGELRFVARPFLNCHLLVLSANLTADYAGERLGCGRLASPFANTIFRHTESRLLNLRSRLGVDRYFGNNHRQILDTFAVLILRNIREGRSTVLISRKKTKSLCAAYLSRRLAAWGVPVRFVHENYTSVPETPDPGVVPILHFGILGVNAFEDYGAAYCLNGYYISSRELSKAAQESTQPTDRVTITIDSRPDNVRRAVVEEGADPGGAVRSVANLYLRKLEIDPVVQAAGRVRFMTKAREVVFLQMADLRPQIGDHRVVGSLAALRAELDIPSARNIDECRDGMRMRAALDSGLTKVAVAAAEGVSVSTVYRRLAAVRRLSIPTVYISRGSDVDQAPGGRP